MGTTPAQHQAHNGLSLAFPKDAPICSRSVVTAAPCFDPFSGDDLWVFAYGSLMWRPGFAFVHRDTGRLYGYRRALCVWSWVHRGTPELPGLVLGLDVGGSCVGFVYRVEAQQRPSVLDYLFQRELITNVYEPRLVRVRTNDGNREALTFVVRRQHPQYAGQLDPERAAAVVRLAVGRSGHNVEYLQSTLDLLHQKGIQAPQLTRVWNALEES